MSYSTYNRVAAGGIARKSSPGGGGGRAFRLNSRKFSVQNLRVRFCFLFRLLGRLRSSYGCALRLLRRGARQGNGGGVMMMRRSYSSQRSLMVVKEAAPPPPSASRMRSFGRSNSFYTEAIADCLEFIKRSSFSVEEIQEEEPICHR